MFRSQDYFMNDDILVPFFLFRIPFSCSNFCNAPRSNSDFQCTHPEIYRRTDDMRGGSMPVMRFASGAVISSIVISNNICKIVSPAVAGCVPFASPSTKKGASKNAQKPRVMHLLKNGWKVVRLCFFSSQKIRLQFRLNNFRDNTDDEHTGSRSIQSTCRFAQH